MVEGRKSVHNIKFKTKRLKEQQVRDFESGSQQLCVCSELLALIYKNIFRSQLCLSKLRSGLISWHVRCAVMVLTSRPDIQLVWDALIRCANHACQIYPRNNAHLIK